MTTEALVGEITKIGKSGRNYVFSFGWACRLNMEKYYGDNLQGMTTENDNFKGVAYLLISALKAKAVNQIKEEISKAEIYELMDDFTEADIKELWEAGKHSLGFINRVLGISEEDLKQLANRALENQNQSTGTSS